MAAWCQQFRPISFLNKAANSWYATTKKLDVERVVEQVAFV
jgi:hypothetical protein